MNRIKSFFATFLACVMAFSSIGIVNAVNVFAYGENRPTYSQEITSITATPHPTEYCPIPTLYDGEMITRDHLRSRVEEYLSKVTLTLHFKDGTTLETTSVLGEHITPAKNYVDYNTMENDDFLEYTYKYFIENETFSDGTRYDKTVKFDVPINQVVPADETHCTSIKIAPNLRLVVADFYAYGLMDDAKQSLIKAFKSYYNGKFSNGSSHNKNFGILAKIEGTTDEIAINPEKLNIDCEITEEAPKATKYASWDNAVVNYFKLRYTYNYGGFSGSYDCFGAQGNSIADGGIDLCSNGYPFADYSVTTPPTKTTYVEGQKFNKAGMVISATTFGSKEISLADDNNINNFDWEKSTFKPSTTYDLTSDSKVYQENRALTTADTEMEVYYGFLNSGTDIFYTATVPIKVVPKEIVGIEVTNQPSKVSYIVGQTFDKNGMVVTATYNDGTTAPITNYVIEDNILKSGQNKVYVTYGDYYDTVDVSVADKEISSIAITTQPKKTSYVEGEKFDDEGMVVTATYNDGSKGVLKKYEYTYPATALTTGNKNVTVSAGNKTASVAVNVVAKTITGIEVTYPPKKTEYIVGQAFATEGMRVTATYNDGSKAEISDYTYEPHIIEDNTKTITVSKSGKTATTPITVVNKAVTSIAVTKQPNKLSYNEGDTFNKAGMVVTATYNDGTSAPISDYVIVDNVLKSGQSKVYITYNNLYTTVDVTVKDTVILTGIKVTKQPSKVSYIAGDTFDNSGMEVKALYSDGTEKVINDYDYSRSPLSGGTNKIYITYKNFFVTVDISVAEKTITSITVTTQPKKTNYVEGEVFNDYGMVVMATYSDGTRSALAPSEYTFSSAPLTLSDKNITISAGSKTTNVSITVVEKVISYINITKEPDKIDYIVGQHFDDTGMIVTAHYNDGTESEIRDYTFSPDVITADTDKIIVTKDGKTDIIRIIVTEKLMTSIAVTKPPKKTTYIENDVFDKTGMVITATYNDGTQTEVKDYVVDSNRLSVGTDKVYITYNGLYTTTPINVIAKSITEIEIITPPSKTNYVEGESFDRTGMVVKAKYDDGSTGILESYEIIPNTPLTVYDSIITVRKDGKTDTTPITVVHKEVVGIKVTRQPDKVEYTEGEIFDVEGMVVTAYYNDNSSSEISDYTYSEEPFKAGDMYVTIEYKGFYDVVPITLAIKNLNSFIKEHNGDVNRDGAVDLTDAGILTKYLGKVTDFAKKAVHTGDTDNDGNLTNDDIVLINNYINGNANLSEASLINADINGDGIVSEVDTDLINKAILNMWDMDTVYELNADANDDGDINMLDVIWILNTHYRHTTIDHIEIVKAPEKTQYVEGQYFDDNGMTVEAVYKDNTREVVTDYTYPERPLEITDTAVEINFEGHKAEQPVTVIKKVIVGSEEDTETTTANSSDEHTTAETTNEQTTTDSAGEQTTSSDCDNSTETTTENRNGNSESTTTENSNSNSEGIRIINLPDKTNYVEGQIFDPAGILIEVLWNDGTKTYIDENGVYVSDIPLTLSDIYGVVYYEYKNGTEKINVPITVIARKAVSAKVVEYPRTEYTEGEKFDKNGTAVEVTYNDGSKETVKDEDIVVKDNKPLTQEDTKVTVVADGAEADIDITVSARETTTETTTSSGNHSGGGAGRKPKTEITTESTTGDAKDKTDIKSETDTKTEPDTETDTKAEQGTEQGTGNTDSGDSEFDDISDHWAEDYIEYLHDKGIFKGVTDDLFMPDISTKRGDFALVLDRMLELDNITSVDALDFTDVPADSYYAEAIANCSRRDLFIGYGNGEFKPEKTITREEMFVIIAKLNNTDIDKVDLSALDDFADGHTVSEWAKPYTAALVEAGIIVGDNGNINPSAEITRAEMATIIYNYITQ